MSYPDHSDEDQQRSRELLVLAAGGGVLCECLGPRPDAEKTHSGEVSARGEFDSLTSVALLTLLYILMTVVYCTHVILIHFFYCKAATFSARLGPPSKKETFKGFTYTYWSLH